MTDKYAERWSTGPVLAAGDGGVLRLTLNRPARKNAMTVEGWGTIFDILHCAETDPEIRVVVIAGAGGDFCAGADISSAPAGHPLERVSRISKTAQSLHDFPKPVIAKVEGAAVGAGWSLALGCDLVVASTSARFSQLFVRRALSIDFGGSWLLPRLVGLQQAKRLVLLGEFVSAQEAERLGLLTWVKEPGEIGPFVDDLAARLAAGPPVALAQNKSLLNQGATLSFTDALANEARAQAVNQATEDFPLALQAFADRTEASYTGRWALP
ncbi:MAG TPA: enoyl-CoA hydratase-related protein [Amycolatopsis sp.]|nr:enoyl-CoA hydratase-related protein [Amycolatopsis sp.]